MPTMNVHCWTEVLVYDTSDQPPILRSLHRCFNLHSYFASGTLNNSHNDGVGQSLAKVSPVAPVTGILAFFFLGSFNDSYDQSPLKWTLRSTSRGTAPVGVYYLGLSTSCSITQKASWMRGKMRASEYIRNLASQPVKFALVVMLATADCDRSAVSCKRSRAFIISLII